jgi:hypothetical protein
VDLRHGRIVEPERAFAASNRYSCPVCKKPVFKRNADIRKSACFVHVSKQANPDCELFHLGFGKGMAGSFDFEKSLLALLFSRQTSVLEFQKWHLELELPTADEMFGSMVIDQGYPSKIERSLASLSTGKNSFRVKPTIEPYSVKVRNAGQSEYAKKLAVPCLGLSNDIPTLFSSSYIGAPRLSSSTPLKWGKRYFVVAKNSEEWPTWSNGAVIKLGDFEDFSAIELQLPIAPEVSVQEWIERRLARSIQAPSPKLKLVYPCSVANEDEIYIVPEKCTAIVCIEKPYLSFAGNTRLEMSPSEQNDGQSIDVKFEENGKDIFVQIEVQSDVTELKIDEDEILILKRSTIPNPSLAKVTVTIQFRGSADTKIFTLGTDEMLAVRELLRLKKADLVGLEIPTDVWPKVSIFHNGEIRSEKDYSDNLNSSTSETELIQKLIAHLQSIKTELGEGYRLDFGSFGVLEVNSSGRLAIEQKEVNVVTENEKFLRQQMLESRSHLGPIDSEETLIKTSLVPMYRQNRNVGGRYV